MTGRLTSCVDCPHSCTNTQHVADKVIVAGRRRVAEGHLGPSRSLDHRALAEGPQSPREPQDAGLVILCQLQALASRHGELREGNVS